MIFVSNGDINNLNTILWGDSHANQLVPVLEIADKKIWFL